MAAWLIWISAGNKDTTWRFDVADYCKKVTAAPEENEAENR